MPVVKTTIEPGILTSLSSSAVINILLGCCGGQPGNSRKPYTIPSKIIIAPEYKPDLLLPSGSFISEVKILSL